MGGIMFGGWLRGSGAWAFGVSLPSMPSTGSVIEVIEELSR